ncbi:hypothetical protein BDY19DRAFT_903533 [Irpex rosettiformis]|uniref:Uncharacterized protein n=1 Tax=Irpex rosettiformis TaxID=378272 RepID=A0ACB8UER1_9APHY|nr:hypothetical protein BDY19DRAFT_903533 [Irpex rosettiformis]
MFQSRASRSSLRTRSWAIPVLSHGRAVAFVAQWYRKLQLSGPEGDRFHLGITPGPPPLDQNGNVSNLPSLCTTHRTDSDMNLCSYTNSTNEGSLPPTLVGGNTPNINPVPVPYPMSK